MANVDILTNTTFHTEMAKVREVIEKGVGGGGGASLPDDVINNKHFVDSMEELAAEMDKNTGADLPIDNQLLAGSPNAIANGVVKAKFDELDQNLTPISETLTIDGTYFSKGTAIIYRYGKLRLLAVSNFTVKSAIASTDTEAKIMCTLSDIDKAQSQFRNIVSSNKTSQVARISTDATGGVYFTNTSGANWDGITVNGVLLYMVE